MITQRFLLLAGFGLFIALLAPPASAIITPAPIASDARIKTMMYSPNDVYIYTGYYRFQSSILFGPDEEIGTISVGDAVPWVFNPVGNRLFLKPVEQDATTNMTLITNKHVYYFELHAAEAKNISDKNLTFELRFVYPEEGGSMLLANNSIDKVPDLEEEDLKKYNFNYTMTGSSDISPIRIFDDGEFTYFQFHDINADIPAFYKVDSQGNESLINFRARGPYIVVERVSAKYTLRLGNSVVCIFNEAWGKTRGAGAEGGLKSSSAAHSSSSSSNKTAVNGDTAK